MMSILKSMVVSAVSLLLTLVGAGPVVAQGGTGVTPSDSANSAVEFRAGRSLDLGVYRVGLSLGNSPRWTGVRVNWSDAGVEGVNGVNLTLWRPRENVAAVYNGLSLGVVASVGETIRGASLSGVAVVADGDLMGAQLAGVALVSGGSVYGINVAGVGAVSSGSMYGLNAAGLGLVANGRLTGVNLAGLGVVSRGGPIEGIVLSPGVIESADRVRGIVLGGYRVKGRRIDGLSLNPVMLKAREFTGVAVGAHNEVMGRQRGLTIGLYNYARQLHGVQLGVLNYARNNPRWLRLLPLVNVHF